MRRGRVVGALFFCFSCAAGGPEGLSLAPVPLASDERVFSPAGPTQPPQKEERPVSLGSPKTSKAAKPIWELSSDYAPQYTYRTAELFRSLEGEAREGELKEALLLCYIDASNAPSYDFFGGKNELGGTIKLGKVDISGNFKSHYVTAPLTTLKTGEKVTVKVYDRDYISRDELIETLSATFEGKLPLKVEGKRTSFSCVALNRQEVELELALLLPEVERALKEVEGELTPDLYNTFSFLPDVFYPAQDRITQIAALVGWDDPSVSSRILRIDQLRDTQKDNLTQALMETYENIPALGEWVEVEDKVLAVQAEVRCDKKNASTYKKFMSSSYKQSFLSAPCVVELQVENKSDQALPCCEDGIGLLQDWSLISFSGAEHPLSPIAVQSEEGPITLSKLTKLAAKEKRTFIFATTTSAFNAKKQGADTPKLLRIKALVTNETKKADYLRWNPQGDDPFFWQEDEIFYLKIAPLSTDTPKP